MLRALNVIWRLNLKPTDLVDTAKKLGADVPYFLCGGPALGLGRGDDITPVDLDLRKKVLLVMGGAPVSTAEVFRRLDREPRPTRKSSPIEELFERGRLLGANRPLSALRNDLSKPAESVGPDLAQAARAVKRAGKASSAALAAMSGSGSTFFLLLDDAAARDLARRSLAEAGFASISTALLSRKRFHDRFEIVRA